MSLDTPEIPVDREDQIASPNPDAWRNPKTTETELIRFSRPVSYGDIVKDTTKVLFLGENHPNSPIREHIANNADALKAAGITHLAIEFPMTEENLQRLKRLPQRLAQGSVDLSWLNRECPAISQDRRNYDVVVRELSRTGIEVVPVDIVQDGSKTAEQREADIATNIEKIIDANPDTKVAVLIGGFHTVKKYSSPDGGLSANGRLIKKGVPTVAVQFVGGFERIPKSVTDAAHHTGLSNKEWMLDMKPYENSQYVPFGAGETDIMIHLPQR